MNYSSKDNIQYRIKRAEEAFEEAVLMANMNRWNTAVSRLYYSCFYIVIALLLKNNLAPSTHEGVKTLFGFHYIKTEVISKEFGKLYSKLFDFRQKGDYGDMYDFTQEIVAPLLEQVPDFLNEIKKHI